MSVRPSVHSVSCWLLDILEQRCFPQFITVVKNARRELDDPVWVVAQCSGAFDHEYDEDPTDEPPDDSHRGLPPQAAIVAAYEPVLKTTLDALLARHDAEHDLIGISLTGLAEVLAVVGLASTGRAGRHDLVAPLTSPDPATRALALQFLHRV